LFGTLSELFWSLIGIQGRNEESEDRRCE